MPVKEQLAVTLSVPSPMGLHCRRRHKKSYAAINSTATSKFFVENFSEVCRRQDCDVAFTKSLKITNRSIKQFLSRVFFVVLHCRLHCRVVIRVTQERKLVPLLSTQGVHDSSTSSTSSMYLVRLYTSRKYSCPTSSLGSFSI